MSKPADIGEIPQTQKATDEDAIKAFAHADVLSTCDAALSLYISLYIYIYAVKLLSGPSLGFLNVIIWSKLGFLNVIIWSKFVF